MDSERGKENGEQRGEHVPGGCSAAVRAQLHAVAGLRLVQLPSYGQDVPAEHTRRPTRRQLDRHRRRRRLGLVEQRLHPARLATPPVIHGRRRKDKNSSRDEIANVNFYVVRPGSYPNSLK